MSVTILIISLIINIYLTKRVWDGLRRNNVHFKKIKKTLKRNQQESILESLGI